MEHSLKLDLLGDPRGKCLKLEIDPKSHSAWTGGNKKYLIKEE